MFEIKELGLALAHVGINCANDEEAMNGAEAFTSILGEPIKNGLSSVFAGKSIELMKKPFLGRHGHLAFMTDDIDLAIKAYTEKGYEFDQSTIKRDAEGRIKAIYFKDEICGFAIHLIGK